jgi:4a-hydroxytetrahydrobiopterin dehydratase
MNHEITQSKHQTKKLRFEARPPVQAQDTKGDMKVSDTTKDTVKKLEPADIQARLRALPGWSLDAGKLYREFHFASFVNAFAFMTKIAKVAEEQAHHPEWFNVYDVVRVHLSTHDAGGISERDFKLAAAMNATFA